MRFSQFKRVYRDYRRETTPEVLDAVIERAEESNPAARGPYLPAPSGKPPAPRRTQVLRLVAAAAAVLLCAGLIGTGYRALQTSQPAGDSSVPTAPTATAPAGTAPRPGDDIPLPVADDPVHFLNYKGFENLPGHTDCGGVYYDFANRSLFCLKARMAEQLDKAGMSVQESAIYIHTYNDVSGLVLFSIDGQAGRPGYCLNLNSGRCYKMRFSMNGTSSHTTLPILPDADTPYIACIKDTAVYLIDGRDGKAVNIGTQTGKGILYDSMGSATFSPDGRYLYYHLGGDDTRTHTALYAVETGKTHTVTGEVLHFSHDSRYLLYRTEKGAFALDCASGKSTPAAAAEGLEAYDLIAVRTAPGTPLPDYNDCNLTLLDLATGQTQAITDTPVNAYTIGGRGRYLYYYRRGEAYIHRLDLATREEAALRADAEFLAATTSEDMQGREIVYYLYAHRHSGELLLKYILTSNRQLTAAEYAAAQHNDPDVQFDSQWDAAGSLSDMADFIRRFPQKITVHRGDGFAVLAYHRERGQLQIAFEDYRTGEMYRLRHNGVSFDSRPEQSDTRMKPLVTDPDGQKLEALLTELPIETAAAPLDYGTLLTHGKLDDRKVFAWSIDTDRLIAATRDFYVRRPDQSLMENLSDLEELRAFLSFAESRSYTPSKLDYMTKKTYELVIYGRQDIIGEILCLVRDGGKPYLYYGGYQSALTQAEYDHWYAWFERMNVEVTP